MPTRLKKPLVRGLNKVLGAGHGPDSHRRLVIRLVPGTDDTSDLLEIWPAKTRQREVIAVEDVYRYAIRCRVNLQQLVKARERKAKKAERKASERIRRADRKLSREAKESARNL